MNPPAPDQLPTDTKEPPPAYDAWLHWQVSFSCNLHCRYCFFHDQRERKLAALPGGLPREARPSWPSRVLATFSRPSARLRRESRSFRATPEGEPLPVIDIPRLMKSLDRTGKTFRIGFTGGEPFLVPNMVEACEAITRRHYVSFNTNLTSPRVPDFARRIDPGKVVLLHASLHIKELERTGLTDRYLRNYRLCQETGFNLMAVQVGYPPLVAEVGKYRKFFEKRGVPIRFYTFEGEYGGKAYPDAYTVEEAAAFGFARDTVIGTFHNRGLLCNAGYNVGIVSVDGKVHPCFSLQGEDLGHIYEGFSFRGRLTDCPFDFCGCPMYEYDAALYRQACREQGVPVKEGGGG